MKTKKFWGGFVDGKLDLLDVDTGWGGFGSGDSMRKMPAVFSSRAEAKRCYMDVRPVDLTTPTTGSHTGEANG